jgi:flagellar L-ring protein precursor FlgH
MPRFVILSVLTVLLLGAPPDAGGQSDDPAPAETSVSPDTRSVRQVSLYADVKARSVGDIVTVAIVERASASNTSRLSTRRSTEFNTENGEGGTGLFSFVPEFGLSAELAKDHDGSGQVSREGRLTARMAAVVTEIRPNGDLVISGEREVWINEEQETLALTGVVRPEDIGSGNVVYSTDIAEAKISYKGKGVVTSGSRPNIISRILGWIF